MEKKRKKAFGGKLSKSIKKKYSLKKWLHGLGKKITSRILWKILTLRSELTLRTKRKKEKKKRMFLPPIEKERRMLVFSALNCFKKNANQTKYITVCPTGMKFFA